jgi:cytidylate kinase
MIKINIAIDGPVASGKSTVAKHLSERLNYLYLDTGLMYRAVTLAALRAKANFQDSQSLIKIAQENPPKVIPDTSSPLGCRIYLQNEEVTSQLNDMQVSAKVSLVAAVKEIRALLVAQQKTLAKNKGIIMAGRDIGTVVMPDAELKVFLTAGAASRAQRRWLELQDKGKPADLSQVKANIDNRDLIDSNRAADPLKAAPDAIMLDSTDLNIEQVVEIIYNWAKEKIGGRRKSALQGRGTKADS